MSQASNIARNWNGMGRLDEIAGALRVVRALGIVPQSELYALNRADYPQPAGNVERKGVGRTVP